MRTSGPASTSSRRRGVIRDRDRIVGYGTVRERGEVWRAEGYVHPAAQGRGLGKLLASAFEREAAARGANRIQNSVYEVDAAACSLLRSSRLSRPCASSARCASNSRRRRRYRPGPTVCASSRSTRSATRIAFHGAQQEAFADHWEYTPRDFESWSRIHLMSERFDPTLWCLVKAGDEVVGEQSALRTPTAAALSNPLHPSPLAQARHRRATPRGRVSQTSGNVASAASASASTRRARPSVSPLRAGRE